MDNSTGSITPLGTMLRKIARHQDVIRYNYKNHGNGSNMEENCCPGNVDRARKTSSMDSRKLDIFNQDSDAEELPDIFPPKRMRREKFRNEFGHIINESKRDSMAVNQETADNNTELHVESTNTAPEPHHIKETATNDNSLVCRDKIRHYTEHKDGNLHKKSQEGDKNTLSEVDIHSSHSHHEDMLQDQSKSSPKIVSSSEICMLSKNITSPEICKISKNISSSENGKVAPLYQSDRNIFDKYSHIYHSQGNSKESVQHRKKHKHGSRHKLKDRDHRKSKHKSSHHKKHEHKRHKSESSSHTSSNSLHNMTGNANEKLKHDTKKHHYVSSLGNSSLNSTINVQSVKTNSSKVQSLTVLKLKSVSSLNTAENITSEQYDHVCDDKSKHESVFSSKVNSRIMSETEYSIKENNIKSDSVDHINDKPGSKSKDNIEMEIPLKNKEVSASSEKPKKKVYDCLTGNKFSLKHMFKLSGNQYHNILLPRVCIEPLVINGVKLKHSAVNTKSCNNIISSCTNSKDCPMENGKVRTMDIESKDDYKKLKTQVDKTIGLDFNSKDNDKKHKSQVDKITTVDMKSNDKDKKQYKVSTLDNKSKDTDRKDKLHVDKITNIDIKSKESDNKQKSQVDKVKTIDIKSKESDKKEKSPVDKITTMDNKSTESNKKQTSQVDKIKTLDNKHKVNDKIEKSQVDKVETMDVKSKESDKKEKSQVDKVKTIDIKSKEIDKKEKSQVDKVKTMDIKSKEIHKKEKSQVDKVKTIDIKSKESDKKEKSQVDKVKTMDVKSKESDKKEKSQVDKVKTMDSKSKEIDKKEKSQVDKVKTMDIKSKEIDKKEKSQVDKVKTMDSKSKESNKKQTSQVDKIKTLDIKSKEIDKKEKSQVDKVKTMDSKSKEIDKKEKSQVDKVKTMDSKSKEINKKEKSQVDKVKTMDIKSKESDKKQKSQIDKVKSMDIKSKDKHKKHKPLVDKIPAMDISSKESDKNEHSQVDKLKSMDNKSKENDSKEKPQADKIKILDINSKDRSNKQKLHEDKSLKPKMDHQHTTNNNGKDYKKYECSKNRDYSKDRHEKKHSDGMKKDSANSYSKSSKGEKYNGESSAKKENSCKSVSCEKVGSEHRKEKHKEKHRSSSKCDKSDYKHRKDKYSSSSKYKDHDKYNNYKDFKDKEHSRDGQGRDKSHKKKHHSKDRSKSRSSQDYKNHHHHKKESYAKDKESKSAKKEGTYKDYDIAKSQKMNKHNQNPVPNGIQEPRKEFKGTAEPRKQNGDHHVTNKQLRINSNLTQKEQYKGCTISNSHLDNAEDMETIQACQNIESTFSANEPCNINENIVHANNNGLQNNAEKNIHESHWAVDSKGNCSSNKQTDAETVLNKDEETSENTHNENQEYFITCNSLDMAEVEIDCNKNIQQEVSSELQDGVTQPNTEYSNGINIKSSNMENINTDGLGKGYVNETENYSLLENIQQNDQNIDSNYQIQTCEGISENNLNVIQESNGIVDCETGILMDNSQERANYDCTDSNKPELSQRNEELNVNYVYTDVMNTDCTEENNGLVSEQSGNVVNKSEANNSDLHFISHGNSTENQDMYIAYGDDGVVYTYAVADDFETTVNREGECDNTETSLDTEQVRDYQNSDVTYQVINGDGNYLYTEVEQGEQLESANKSTGENLAENFENNNSLTANENAENVQELLIIECDNENGDLSELAKSGNLLIQTVGENGDIEHSPIDGLVIDSIMGNATNVFEAEPGMDDCSSTQFQDENMQCTEFETKSEIACSITPFQEQNVESKDIETESGIACSSTASQEGNVESKDSYKGNNHSGSSGSNCNKTEEQKKTDFIQTTTDVFDSLTKGVRDVRNNSENKFHSLNIDLDSQCSEQLVDNSDNTHGEQILSHDESANSKIVTQLDSSVNLHGDNQQTKPGYINYEGENITDHTSDKNATYVKEASQIITSDLGICQTSVNGSSLLATNDQYTDGKSRECENINDIHCSDVSNSKIDISSGNEVYNTGNVNVESNFNEITGNNKVGECKIKRNDNEGDTHFKKDTLLRTTTGKYISNEGSISSQNVDISISVYQENLTNPSISMESVKELLPCKQENSSTKSSLKQNSGDLDTALTDNTANINRSDFKNSTSYSAGLINIKETSTHNSWSTANNSDGYSKFESSSFCIKNLDEENGRTKDDSQIACIEHDIAKDMDAESKCAENDVAKYRDAESKYADNNLAIDIDAESKYAENYVAKDIDAESKYAENYVAKDIDTESKCAENDIAIDMNTETKYAETEKLVVENDVAKQFDGDSKQAVNDIAKDMDYENKYVVKDIAKNIDAATDDAENNSAKDIDTEMKYAENDAANNMNTETKYAETIKLEENIYNIPCDETEVKPQADEDISMKSTSSYVQEMNCSPCSEIPGTDVTNDELVNTGSKISSDDDNEYNSTGQSHIIEDNSSEQSLSIAKEDLNNVVGTCKISDSLKNIHDKQTADIVSLNTTKSQDMCIKNVEHSIIKSYEVPETTERNSGNVGILKKDVAKDKRNVEGDIIESKKLTAPCTTTSSINNGNNRVIKTVTMTYVNGDKVIKEATTTEVFEHPVPDEIITDNVQTVAAKVYSESKKTPKTGHGNITDVQKLGYSATPINTDSGDVNGEIESQVNMYQEKTMDDKVVDNSESENKLIDHCANQNCHAMTTIEASVQSSQVRMKDVLDKENEELHEQLLTAKQTNINPSAKNFDGITINKDKNPERGNLSAHKPPVQIVTPTRRNVENSATTTIPPLVKSSTAKSIECSSDTSSQLPCVQNESTLPLMSRDTALGNNLEMDMCSGFYDLEDDSVNPNGSLNAILNSADNIIEACAINANIIEAYHTVSIDSDELVNNYMVDQSENETQGLVDQRKTPSSDTNKVSITQSSSLDQDTKSYDEGEMTKQSNSHVNISEDVVAISDTMLKEFDNMTKDVVEHDERENIQEEFFHSDENDDTGTVENKKGKMNEYNILLNKLKKDYIRFQNIMKVLLKEESKNQYDQGLILLKKKEAEALMENVNEKIQKKLVITKHESNFGCSSNLDKQNLIDHDICNKKSPVLSCGSATSTSSKEHLTLQLPQIKINNQPVKQDIHQQDSIYSKLNSTDIDGKILKGRYSGEIHSKLSGGEETIPCKKAKMSTYVSNENPNRNESVKPDQYLKHSKSKISSSTSSINTKIDESSRENVQKVGRNESNDSLKSTEKITNKTTSLHTEVNYSGNYDFAKDNEKVRTNITYETVTPIIAERQIMEKDVRKENLSKRTFDELLKPVLFCNSEEEANLTKKKSDKISQNISEIMSTAETKSKEKQENNPLKLNQNTNDRKSSQNIFLETDTNSKLADNGEIYVQRRHSIHEVKKAEWVHKMNAIKEKIVEPTNGQNQTKQTNPHAFKEERHIFDKINILDNSIKGSKKNEGTIRDFVLDQALNDHRKTEKQYRLNSYVAMANQMVQDQRRQSMSVPPMIPPLRHSDELHLALKQNSAFTLYNASEKQLHSNHKIPSPPNLLKSHDSPKQDSKNIIQQPIQQSSERKHSIIDTDQEGPASKIPKHECEKYGMQQKLPKQKPPLMKLDEFIHSKYMMEPKRKDPRVYENISPVRSGVHHMKKVHRSIQHQAKVISNAEGSSNSATKQDETSSSYCTVKCDLPTGKCDRQYCDIHKKLPQKVNGVPVPKPLHRPFMQYQLNKYEMRQQQTHSTTVEKQTDSNKKHKAADKVQTEKCAQSVNIQVNPFHYPMYQPYGHYLAPGLHHHKYTMPQSQVAHNAKEVFRQPTTSHTASPSYPYMYQVPPHSLPQNSPMKADEQLQIQCKVNEVPLQIKPIPETVNNIPKQQTSSRHNSQHSPNLNPTFSAPRPYIYSKLYHHRPQESSSFDKQRPLFGRQPLPQYNLPSPATIRPVMNPNTPGLTHPKMVNVAHSGPNHQNMVNAAHPWPGPYPHHHTFPVSQESGNTVRTTHPSVMTSNPQSLSIPLNKAPLGFYSTPSRSVPLPSNFFQSRTVPVATSSFSHHVADHAKDQSNESQFSSHRSNYSVSPVAHPSTGYQQPRVLSRERHTPPPGLTGMENRQMQPHIAQENTATNQDQRKVVQPMQSCGTCKKEATLMCSGCGIAKYCSTTCQREVWPEHEKVCKRNSNNDVHNDPESTEK